MLVCARYAKEKRICVRVLRDVYNMSRDVYNMSQAIRPRLTHDMKKHTHNMSRWVGDMRSICAASGDIRTQEERQKFS